MDELMFTFDQWVKRLSKKQPKTTLTQEQLLAFEYIVMGLVQWWIDSNPDKDFEKDNDLSMLKVLKLHFFVCAVDTTKNKEAPLLDLFSFTAMPYGHVCKEIYDYIRRKGEFDNFILSNKALILKKPV